MAKIWTLVYVYVLYHGVLSPTVIGERVLGQDTEEFDFDGLPGAQHEFKIFVAAGKEECFYQPAVSGGKMHISFEVLRGGDQSLNICIRRPSSTVLDESRTQSSWNSQMDIDETGAYSICLDNSFSRMASKLVYVYMITFVEEEWNKYVKEIEDVHLAVSNFSASIHAVQTSISESITHMAQSRLFVIKDWYLIKGNNEYIQYWSIFQCAVIVACSVFQVYFVRRLFRVSNVTPTSKPRA